MANPNIDEAISIQDNDKDSIDKLGKKFKKLDITLNDIIKKALPSNYDFEIPKTIKRLSESNAKVVALQMPEGLLHWACEIASILKFYANLNEILIMSDVTYGACCIDDLSAISVGCDFIVHYGHSCLIPVYKIDIPVLYVFVEITFNHHHLVDTLVNNFKPTDKLYIMGTIQYISNSYKISSDDKIKNYFKNPVIFPKTRPLMSGEVLGCTSPRLDISNENKNELKVIFIADGRFHLESAMIHNPDLEFFRYDPFVKTITHEKYDFIKLNNTRNSAIQLAKSANLICLILSTLGRQGNTNIYSEIERMLVSKGKKCIKMLLSEIVPSKLAQLKDVDTFIQVGCPRLSIDWGMGFTRHLLNPYEAYVAFGDVEYRSVYPMDYYSSTGGVWTNESANRRCGDTCNNIDLIRKRLKERQSIKIKLED